MWVGITGLVISALLSSVYLIIENKKNFIFSITSRFFATMSYIVFALILQYFIKPGYNLAYIYIILGLILVMVADVALELRDRPHSGQFMVIASSVLCVLFKIFSIVALIYLGENIINFSNLFYPALIAIAMTIVIIVVLKYAIKLDLSGQLINSIIYFIVASYMTVLSVWFAVLIPSLWAYAVFACLIFVNDLLLINVNLGEYRSKQVLYNFQRITYYLSLLFLLYFLYFYFPVY